MKSPINPKIEREKQKHFAAEVQRRQSVELKGEVLQSAHAFTEETTPVKYMSDNCQRVAGPK